MNFLYVDVMSALGEVSGGASDRHLKIEAIASRISGFDKLA